MKNHRLSVSSVASVLSVTFALGLSGCSANFGTTSDTATQTAVHIQGRVHGGQQPISGSHVYMYAASNAAYGGNGIASTAGATGNASVSLLTSATGNPADTNGNFYVTTDVNGNFSINGAFACSSGQQVYLYSTGGDPQLNGVGVAGTPNSAASLMAVVGDCSSSTFPGVTSVFMNEVTTVAAAYALAGFATDPLHIGAPSAVAGHALARTGFANAFNTALNIVSQTTGVPNATLPLNATAAVPVTTINTLADILAACINSNGVSSSGCSTLFTNTNYGTMPTDTATAAINIAQHPAANVSALLNLATNASPFQSILTSANDLTLGIQYTGGNLRRPQAVAIDGAGNAWVTDNTGNSVTKVSSGGAFLSGASGFSGLNGPFGIAIDLSGNAWVTNSLGTSITEFTNNGVVLGSYSTGNMQARSVAIDSAGNGWVANFIFDSGVLNKFSPSGTPLKTYNGHDLNEADAIALDGAGNAWVASTPGEVTEFANATALPFALISAPDLPTGIAIDSAGNAWTSDFENAVIEYSNAGVVLNTYTGAGLNNPEGISIDGAGNVWASNFMGNSVTEFSKTGTVLSGVNGYTSSGLTFPESIAVDGSGNVWVPSLGGNYLTELIGIGAPVITPIAAGLPAVPTTDGSSKLGTRP
ncbi:NHL repeat-containing protein [Granulicella mallensis]|uniref:NHL repeat containing protein n=1 Tax=Granulicella mallensis (strain ATCC BAA-1857 / DSM 23137 / MP5ACTX8) TaxID=682795 RepID=G8NPY4_GRAMM|nr:hypothetical protein [Granulicella mallensis]AEU38318.1 NHL repeat containing protein [Granulicella mallensis MP5ACTX8]